MVKFVQLCPAWRLLETGQTNILHCVGLATKPKRVGNKEEGMEGGGEEEEGEGEVEKEA